MKSIEEQITENLTKSLRDVRTNRGANFNASAEEADRQGSSNLSANLTIRSDMAQPLNNGSLGRDHYTKRYFIECPVSVSDDALATGDTDEKAASRLAADVYKTVMADYQRGELALNTKWIKTDYGALTESFGAVLTFEVHFWTLRDDPFTQ